LRLSSRKQLVPLDDFLPDFQWNEVHSTHVAAPSDRVLTALRELTSREVPLLVALMAIRLVPEAIVKRSTGRLKRRLDAPLLDQFRGSGFVELAERPDEVVFGVVGRFWTIDGGLEPVSAEDFIPFDAPGFAKGAINFRARVASGGTLLTTETRIQATDDSAARSFGRYWRVVGPPSAAIRRAWLRAIRKRAERSFDAKRPTQSIHTRP
jgi:hypothetical protein